VRLLRACAAYVLPHALRPHTLSHPALAHAQPSTVLLTLFQVATQINQSKARILLHLPSACPAKALLPRVTALLSAVPAPLMHPS
jgi:Transposase DDE domain group 1